MALQAGIVGLPNVGKSTLFNALTAAGAESANYPFCTIEPNTGIVAVPDPRLEQLRSMINSKQLIPAAVEIVDIAGLVRGASKGEGLATSSWATSAVSMRFCMLCVALRTTTSTTWTAEWTRRATSRPSIWS